MKLPSPSDRPAISPGGAPASAAAGVESGQQAASSQFLAAARGWGTDVSRAVQGIAQEQFNAAQQRMHRDSIITVDSGVNAYKQKVGQIDDQYATADFSDPKVQQAYTADLLSARKQIGDSLGVDDNHMAEFNRQTSAIETDRGIGMFKRKEAAQQVKILGMAHNGIDQQSADILVNPERFTDHLRQSDQSLEYLRPGMDPHTWEAVTVDRNNRFLESQINGYLLKGDPIAAQRALDAMPPDIRTGLGVRDVLQNRIISTVNAHQRQNEHNSAWFNDFTITNGRNPTAQEMADHYAKTEAAAAQPSYSVKMVPTADGKGMKAVNVNNRTGEVTDIPDTGTQPYGSNNPITQILGGGGAGVQVPGVTTQGGGGAQGDRFSNWGK